MALGQVDAQVVVISGHGNIESAVRAIKMGAYDFMLKPPDLDHLGVVLERAIEAYLGLGAPAPEDDIGAREGSTALDIDRLPG